MILNWFWIKEPLLVLHLPGFLCPYLVLILIELGHLEEELIAKLCFLLGEVVAPLMGIMYFQNAATGAKFINNIIGLVRLPLGIDTLKLPTQASTLIIDDQYPQD